MTKLVVFDLDGTVVNTLADIAGSLNAALAQCGFPTLSDEKTKSIIGHSVGYMCEHAVPETALDRSGEVLDCFTAHYHKHCCDRSLPYPGLNEVLTQLKNAGLTLAVVSNKPHPEAVKVIGALFDRRLFSLILGRMERFRLKPDPEPLRFAIDTLGFTGAETVYVGDSEVDVDFASNAGIEEIAVDWGYRTHEELVKAGAKRIASTPEALLNMILAGGDAL